MKKIIFTLLALISLLMACNKELPPPVDPVVPDIPVDTVKVETKLLVERDAAHLLSTRTGIVKANDTLVINNGVCDFEDVMCRTFRLGKYPYADVQNVGYYIFDFEKYCNDHPNTFESFGLFSSADICDVFVGFDQLSGFDDLVCSSGNYNIFNIRAQQAYQEILNLTPLQANTNVIGHFGFQYKYRKYRTLVMPSDFSEIRENYILKTFTDDLYNNSAYALLKHYGEFVLGQFCSGCKLIALYSGDFEGEQSDQKASSMIKEMKSTFGKRNGSESATVGKNESETVSETGDFSDISFAVRAYGCMNELSQFTKPCGVNQAIHDVTDWYAEINDADKYTLISLPDQSLIALSEFVEEHNLKAMMSKIYKSGYDQAHKDIVEPHIEILIDNGSEQLSAQTSLVTRYGERIVLNKTELTSSVEEHIAQQVERASKHFAGLKMVSVVTNAPKNLLTTATYKNILFDKSVMTKHIDDQTGKTYILTEDTYGDKKIAYTLYDSNVIGDYIFQEFVDGIEKVSVDQRALRSYYLIAL